jgi:hypothetical protein
LGGHTVDGTIISKWISTGWMWTGFNWLAKEMNDELLQKEADRMGDHCVDGRIILK